MLSKLRLILSKSIKNKKLNVFSLFFLLAFVILVLSKLSKSYTEVLTIDINYINLPEDKVLTLEKLPKLNVEVTTFGFNLLRSYFYDKSIAIDFEKDTYIKNNTYIWVANRAQTSIEKQFGSSFKIESIQPDTLNFPFGTLSVKNVPVKLNSNVTYASGYDTFKGMVITPDSVKVIGSDTEIKNIRFIETSELNLLNVKTNIDAIVKLKRPEGGHTLKLSQNDISVKAEVQKFTEGTMEIPIEINNIPPETKINYFPKTVKVTYEVSLNDYNSIKPTGFKIECDYLEIEASNKSYFIAKFKKIPKNVKRVKMKQDKIEYVITE